MNTPLPFLHICIQDILIKHGTDFSNSIIILPNKRPILFIKKYLSQEITTPCFLPKFYTIQEFFMLHTQRSIVHEIQCIHIIYTLYKKYTGSTETFEEFYSWGEMLLQDFNDIDTYCIPVEDLFANLSAIKEFTNTFDYLSEEQIAIITRFWDTTKHTTQQSIQTKFLTIWQALLNIYKDCKQELSTQKLGYKGMIFREIVENASSMIQLSDSTKLFFIGFNALNTCEIQLFTFCKTKKQAYFYWDYDQYYATKTHEAGYFITKNIKLFGNEIHQDYYNAFKKPKQINIIETPNPISQVKQCESLLKSYTSNSGAIVLADEQLLIPLLQSIPETVQYNVSLGYPIKQTEAYSFFEIIIRIQQHISSGNINTKLLQSFCNHSYSKIYLYESCNAIINQINNYTYSYIPLASVPIDDTIRHFIIKKTNTPYLQFLKNCITFIISNSHPNPIDSSIWYTIYTEIENLELTLQNSYIQSENITFLNSLLQQTISSKSVPIAGEPLQGIQIMGILETRLLDFESITILSANEHILPKKSPGSSFIPYSLRVAFGMPTIKEHNAIFAYYFYRIIQRANTVNILYSTQTNEQGTGEKSRYITQLMYELNQYNTKAHIQTSHISYPILPASNTILHYSKNTEEFSNFIEALHTEKRFLSPTSLYRYIECPLKFYFSVIANIRKPQEIKELPDNRDYGNFFHTAIENIYIPYINTLITSNTIDTILQNSHEIDTIVYNAISQVISNKNNVSIDENTVTLQKNVIKKYITNMLEFDKKQAPFTIIGLEHEIKHTFTIANTKIPIRGIIDRLQKNGNNTSILDYKTGKNKNTCETIKSIFDGTYATSNSAIFQICLYAYIIQLQNPTETIEPHLVFLRDLHTNTTTNIYQKELKKHIQSYVEIHEIFEEYFNKTILSILDLQTPFTQTNDTKTCSYCDFKIFCKKQ